MFAFFFVFQIVCLVAFHKIQLFFDHIVTFLLFSATRLLLLSKESQMRLSVLTVDVYVRRQSSLGESRRIIPIVPVHRETLHSVERSHRLQRSIKSITVLHENWNVIAKILALRLILKYYIENAANYVITQRLNIGLVRPLFNYRMTADFFSEFLSVFVA